MDGRLKATGDQVGHGLQGLQRHRWHAILEGPARLEGVPLWSLCEFLRHEPIQMLRARMQELLLWRRRKSRRHQAVHLLRACVGEVLQHRIQAACCRTQRRVSVQNRGNSLSLDLHNPRAESQTIMDWHRGLPSC